jgi:hypothetical protein
MYHEGSQGGIEIPRPDSAAGQEWQETVQAALRS